MNYSKWEIKKANELNAQIPNFNVTPHIIHAYSALWDTIERFACWNVSDVQNAVSTKEDVPQKLKSWVIKIIREKGNTNTFFSQHLKLGNNFNVFVKQCIKNKINPAEYLFAGALSIKDTRVEEHTFSA